MNIIGYTDFVEYQLVSEFQGAVVIEEPINYDEGNDNIYERDKKSKGFLTNRTNTLQFYNTGASFLRRQINSRGVAEAVLMHKYIKSENRLDQEWRLVSESYIDMHTLSFDESNSSEGVAKAKAAEGGLKKVIDSKRSDQYDLTNTIGFLGADIGPLPTQTILLEPKKIFLKSRIEAVSGDKIAQFTVTGGDNDDGRAIPFRIEFSSDENIRDVYTDPLAVGGEDYATLKLDQLGSLFYKNPLDGVPRILVLNGYIEIEKIAANSGPGIYTMEILKYENGEDYDFQGRVELNTGGTVIDSYSGNVVNGTKLSGQLINQEVEVQPGESVTIGVLGRNLDDGQLWQVNEAYLDITEDSSYPPSTARAITYYDAATRLMELMTGRQDAVISSLLTEYADGSPGEMSEKLITQGFWVRGFPDIVAEGTDEERRIQFTLSFENLLKDINTHIPVAWWVERGADDEEYLHIEKYAYTQQNFVGIPYGNYSGANFVYTPASDVQRKVLGDNFFSTIKIGSKKGGDNYEEVFGLQSIQGQAEYGTINTNSKAKYEALSPFRLGDIDVELPRRKPYSLRPDEDTKYDSDKIVLDCYIQDGKYYLKKWDDSFAEPPTGLYDYESAYNLEHTPARLLLKHGNIVNSGLYHYPNEVLRFQSSNCNSAFSGRKDGENTLYEGENISHDLLDAPYVRPWGATLICDITQEIEDAIIGKTEGIPNWFGLVAVEVKGNVEYFRLIKADVNGEGKHELVEAYRL